MVPMVVEERVYSQRWFPSINASLGRYDPYPLEGEHHTPSLASVTNWGERPQCLTAFENCWTDTVPVPRPYHF